MNSRKIGPAIVAVCTLVLLTGCAQPNGPDIGKTAAQTSSPLPAEQWDVIRLADPGAAVAAIGDSSGQSALMIRCEEATNTLSASLVLNEKITGDPERRHVAMFFDAGGFAMPGWRPRAQTNSAPTAFDIVYEKRYDGDFWPLVANLKKHDQVSVAIKQDGKEGARHLFSLAGAVEAIDAVLERCGQPEAPRGPLLEQYWWSE